MWTVSIAWCKATPPVCGSALAVAAVAAVVTAAVAGATGEATGVAVGVLGAMLVGEAPAGEPDDASCCGAGALAVTASAISCVIGSLVVMVVVVVVVVVVAVVWAPEGVSFGCD